MNRIDMANTTDELRMLTVTLNNSYAREGQYIFERSSCHDRACTFSDGMKFTEGIKSKLYSS